jgi:hypothetical protein
LFSFETFKHLTNLTTITSARYREKTRIETELRLVLSANDGKEQAFTGAAN